MQLTVVTLLSYLPFDAVLLHRSGVPSKAAEWATRVCCALSVAVGLPQTSSRGTVSPLNRTDTFAVNLNRRISHTDPLLHEKLSLCAEICASHTPSLRFTTTVGVVVHLHSFTIEYTTKFTMYDLRFFENTISVVY